MRAEQHVASISNEGAHGLSSWLYEQCLASPIYFTLHYICFWHPAGLALSLAPSSRCRCGRFGAAFLAAARARAPSGAAPRSTTIGGRRWARCRRCRCSATPTWSDWSRWPDVHAARLAAMPRSSCNRRAPWSNERTAALMRPPRSSAEQLICWRATIGTMPLVSRLGQRHVVEWAMAEL